MSTPPLKDLLAQRAALEQQIIEARRTERAEAITRIRALMSEYGLTIADLQAVGGRAGSKAASGTAGSKVPPKYVDRASGHTWSGRGLQPRWLKEALASGRQLAEFAV
ncbi:MAG: H-NS histone family protein [Rubrivivax sp.]|jgi:DNA-binding protein H-NS|nr:H-NS histone family protein [Rubrivivax sp.]